MMTDCFNQLTFWDIGRQQVILDFDGGSVVTDAGLLSEWLGGRSVEEAGRIGPADLMRHFGPRAGAIDAAGQAISGLRQALAQIPKTAPACHQAT